MTLPTPFPAARYSLHCTVQTPVHLPDYAGSTLRGAFGHALKKVACMTRQSECKPCPLYSTCPYPAIFSPPPPAEHSLQKFSEIPVPFIVEPPDWGARSLMPGESFQFGLVLIGPALKQLPLIVHAWQRALEHGIGKGQGQVSLTQVDWEYEPHGPPHPIYTLEDTQIANHNAVLPPAPIKVPQTISVHHTTPLRLQHQGKPIDPKVLTPDEFLVQLIRRIALLSEFHLKHPVKADFSGMKAQAKQLTAVKNMHWQDWKRYSNRQQQTMALGGAIGHWQISGELSPFWPWLWAGQWLHAGKNASFGLGRYVIDSLPLKAQENPAIPQRNQLIEKEKQPTRI